MLLIPGLILALVTAHLFMMFFQKHTQMPGKGRTNENVVGAPIYPYFMAKTGAFFFFTFAALTLAATFAQINPIWLYGPFNPVAMSAGSQPDFYMGMLEGALRIMPAWQWVVFGHTFAFNVFIPALLPLGLVFTGAAFWPFLEQWVTGDRREHHINDRPRNAATRTALGIAVIAFYGILWAEGANDVIADHLNVPLYWITWAARVGIFVRSRDRLHHHQAHLPWPAAQGQPPDRARRGDRHHQAAAWRRVHRGDQAARRGDSGGADRRPEIPALPPPRRPRPTCLARHARRPRQGPRAALPAVTESVPLGST